MDKHTLHNIIHRDSGNVSQNCPICNGSLDMNDSKALMTKAGEILTRKQQMGMTYEEDEKELLAFNEKQDKGEQVGYLQTSVDIMTFSEDGVKLPTRIKVIPIAKIKDQRYNEVNIDKGVILDMIKNFNDSIRASSKDAGLPIDIDHGKSIHGNAAAGWIKKLHLMNDGGYADVEWTDLGKEVLIKKLFKFYSPAFYLNGYIDNETGKPYRNIMIGGGLVNTPGMSHSLPPILNSEEDKNKPLTIENKNPMLFIEIKNTAQSMNLKDITAKEKTQRNSDEQKYLVDHKEELTFAEYKAEGFLEAPKETPKPGVITMSEAEAIKLRDDATKGQLAFKELERQKMISDVKALVFTDKGSKLPTDQIVKTADMMLTMDEAGREMFREHLKNLPEAKIFVEEGSDRAKDITNSDSVEDAGMKFNEMTKERAAKDKITFEEAQRLITKENPDLVNQIYG